MPSNENVVPKATKEWADSRFEDLDDERRELLTLVIEASKERANDMEERALAAEKSAKSSQRWVYLLATLCILFALTSTALVLDRSFSLDTSTTIPSIKVGEQKPEPGK